MLFIRHARHMGTQWPVAEREQDGKYKKPVQSTVCRPAK